MKKRTLSFIVLLLIICMLLQPPMTLYAQKNNFLATTKCITLQYVPIGNGLNCYSEKTQIYDGQCKDVRLLIQKEDHVSDSVEMTEHLISAALQDSSWSAYDCFVSVSNARIVTVSNETISLDELNGVHQIGRDGNADNDFFASTSSEPCKVGNLVGGYFCATVSVCFDVTNEVYYEKAQKLQQLVTMEGTLPEDCFYEVNDNEIQLIDFSFDGTMTIHGSESYPEVVLVIRGNCDITNLILECPVTIKRYAYASLCGTEYSVTGEGVLTFDESYNRSSFHENKDGYAITFDETISGSDLTQSELDEKNDTYNFEWRSRKSAWYQNALENIKNLRTQSVTIQLTDPMGSAVTDAQIHLRLEDYDYYLGAAHSGAYYQNNSNWIFQQDETDFLRDNILVSYDEFAWENYDNSFEGNADNTYSFDYSSCGNTNYLRDKVSVLQNHNVKVIAQPLVYPSIYAMSDLYHRENQTVTDSLKEYIFSEEYTPEGFDQKIKEHIAEEITSYAGYVYIWAVVNEEYYYNEFFQLIYGIDDAQNGFAAGNGFTKEQISKILENENKTAASTDEKMETLQNYLKIQDRIPAEIAGKIVCSWAEEAQNAWNATINEQTEYTADDLILYCNDACWMDNNDEDEAGHYPYFYEYAKALSDPQNYTDGKVLIKVIGQQMAQFKYHSNPIEALNMLDDIKNINETMLVTEGNYWVDNPTTTTGTDLSNYGYGPEEYHTSDITSETEKEYAYDYAYYMMTALYSHPASVGVYWVGYPSGQIGCYYYGGERGLTPLGYAYRDLTMKEWNSSIHFVMTGSSYQTGPMTCGTYIATVKKDGKLYQKEIIISKSTDTINIVLDQPLTGITEDNCVHEFTDQPYITDDAGKHYQLCRLCGIESEHILCTAGKSVIENTIAAASGVSGSHEEVTYCKICGQELSRIKKIDPAINDTGNDTGASDADEKLEAVTISRIENVSKGIKISWNRNTSASGYYIFRCINNKKYKKIATINKNSKTNYTDLKATKNGTVYRYKVVCYNRNNISTDSNTKTIYRLNVPSKITVSTQTKRTAVVKWKKNKYASGYEIRYITGKKMRNVKVTNKATVKKVIKSLKKGKIYKIQIRCYKKNKGTTYYSAWSNLKKIKITK